MGIFVDYLLICIFLGKGRMCKINSGEHVVLSRNHLTSHLNIDVSKLTIRDIQKILRHWLNEEPVARIAQEFQVSRQRVNPLITQFKEKEEFPELKPPGRRPQPIDPGTEGIILESYHANKLGPIHLEKKIEETYWIFTSPITGSIRYCCSTAWWRST